MPEPMPGSVQSFRRSCLTVLVLSALVVLALLVMLVGGLLDPRGVHGWVAYILAAIAVAIALSAIFVTVLLLDRRLRRLLVALLRQIPRENERRDIAAARRAVDHPGRLTNFERFTAWTDTPHDFEPTLERAVREAGEHFADLTGLPAEMSSPLRVLCFERAEDLAEYARTGGLEAEHLRGYYAGLFHKRVVICRETSERVPNTLLGTLAHELTHHLFRTAVRHAPPPWLDEGVPEAVAARCAERLSAPGAEQRALRAAQARGHLLLGREMFALTRLELSRWVARWQDPSDCAFVTAFYRHSRRFVDFLHERDADALRRFVQRLPRQAETPAWFEVCFGLPPDAAAGECLAGIEAMEIPPFGAPPEELRARMERELVRHIAHPYEQPGTRLLAIHLLAGTGYPWHARALVEALADQNLLVRAHAQFALEDLAGDLRGDDPDDWTAWLDSLPDGVVAPPNEEP